MKKALAFLFCFVTLQIAAVAAGENENKEVKTNFKILVIDANTEEPIPAATINFNKKEQQSYTDFDGLAEIKNVQPGMYDLEISFLSYKKQQIKNYKLDISSNKLVVKLNP